jgi:hypothetical protein
MKCPFKGFFVCVTCSLFIATMMEHTDAQIVSVTLEGFDAAISSGTNDPLPDHDNTYVVSDES